MGATAVQPAEDAHRSLLRAFGSLRKAMEPYFARFGISRPQWAVLIVLHRSEQAGVHGMRLRDPARAIAVNWETYRSPETRYCPAGVYEWVEEASIRATEPVGTG